MVRGSRPVAQPADQVGDFAPFHVRDFHLAQRGEDVGFKRDPVASDGGRFVPRLRVLDHEAVGQIFYGRGHAGDLALLARIAAAAHGGQEVWASLRA